MAPHYVAFFNIANANLTWIRGIIEVALRCH